MSHHYSERIRIYANKPLGEYEHKNIYHSNGGVTERLWAQMKSTAYRDSVSLTVSVLNNRLKRTLMLKGRARIAEEVLKACFTGPWKSFR